MLGVRTAFLDKDARVVSGLQNDPYWERRSRTPSMRHHCHHPAACFMLRHGLFRPDPSEGHPVETCPRRDGWMFEDAFDEAKRFVRGEAKPGPGSSIALLVPFRC